jgi:N-acetyl-gamma-glutamyl-phosphate reductase
MKNNNVMTNVAVIGASGYVGGELLRLLLRHPHVRIASVTSEQSVGKSIRSLFPNLAGPELMYEAFDPVAVAGRAEVCFLALPHTKSAPAAATLVAAGRKVIDLSADFRLKDPAIYAHWYHTPHPCPSLLKTAVYGLPELYRTAIASATLIASPGCYPTAALLSLAPLTQHRLLGEFVVIDAKSGISGAGRSPSLSSHFPEANESIEAYQLGQHRHVPEIEQELGMTVSFTPHLVPMTRGILSTAYVRLREPTTSARLTDLYRDCYKDEPFVRILDPGQAANPRHTRGSNFCDISVFADERTGWTILSAALDNLVKGAAGQAVQAMNLMQGWPETAGLQDSGLYP